MKREEKRAEEEKRHEKAKEHGMGQRFSAAMLLPAMLPLLSEQICHKEKRSARL